MANSEEKIMEALRRFRATYRTSETYFLINQLEQGVKLELLERQLIARDKGMNPDYAIITDLGLLVLSSHEYTNKIVALQARVAVLEAALHNMTDKPVHGGFADDECAYCRCSGGYEIEDHEPDCPWGIARAVLLVGNRPPTKAEIEYGKTLEEARAALGEEPEAE